MSSFLFLSSCPNPADQTVKVEGNGLGTSNYFSFNAFQFSGHTGDVYLHCRVELCVRQGNTCAPVRPECIHINAQIRILSQKARYLLLIASVLHP